MPLPGGPTGGTWAAGGDQGRLVALADEHSPRQRRQSANQWKGFSLTT